jgi:FkbM family methyltransferase
MPSSATRRTARRTSHEERVNSEIEMSPLSRYYLYRAVDSLLSPRLAWWRTRGVILGLYQDLNRPWLLNLRPRTVLDIGANVGRFAITARKLFPTAHIYSFEPLADCLAEAERVMHGDRMFTGINIALGVERGQATFQRNNASPSSSFLKVTHAHTAAFPGTDQTTETTVSMDALDNVAEGLKLTLPLLVKIDVQGFENQVLRGGEKTIRQAAVILVETSFETLYEGQALFEDIHQRLKSWGFDFRGNLDQSYAPTDGRLLQADSLFVKQGVLV